MMFSWRNPRSISISCLKLTISFSLLLCLRMNFIATVWPVYFLRPLYTYEQNNKYMEKRVLEGIFRQGMAPARTCI